MWNGTVDVTKAAGDQLLDRDVTLDRRRPAGGDRTASATAASTSSTPTSTPRGARIADGRPWPDDGSWRTLIAENHLADLVPPSDVRPHGGTIDLRFALPMPAVSLIELAPA